MRCRSRSTSATRCSSASTAIRTVDWSPATTSVEDEEELEPDADPEE